MAQGSVDVSGIVRALDLDNTIYNILKDTKWDDTDGGGEHALISMPQGDPGHGTGAVGGARPKGKANTALRVATSTPKSSAMSGLAANPYVAPQALTFQTLSNVSADPYVAPQAPTFPTLSNVAANPYVAPQVSTFPTLSNVAADPYVNPQTPTFLATSNAGASLRTPASFRAATGPVGRTPAPRLSAFSGFSDYAPRDSHVARKPVVMPDTYAGTTNIGDWLTHFERCQFINSWTPADSCNFLAVRLKGVALQFYNEIGPNERNDYFALVAALKDRFDPIKDMGVYLAELSQRVRRKGEGVMDLASSIQRLVEKAYPFTDEFTKGVVAVQHFTNSLENREIQMQIRRQQPSKLMEAVKIAINEESYTRLDTGLSSKTRVAAVSEPQSSSLPTLDLEKKIRELQQQVESLKVRRTDTPRPQSTPAPQPQPSRPLLGQNQTDPRQFYGKPSVPPPNQYQTPYRGPPSGGLTPNPPRSNLQCFGCGNYGHYRRDCPLNR
jgi:hypothetical protein